MSQWINEGIGYLGTLIFSRYLRRNQVAPMEIRFVVRGSLFIVKPKNNTAEKSKNQQKMMND